MPFLYEGRQHKRSGRESLDCAMMLKELHDMGVSNFITFDAHDPACAERYASLSNFDNFLPPYQYPAHADALHLDDLVRSTRSTSRSSARTRVPWNGRVYFASVIGADTGMFYKRRDYSKIVGGKNPIVAHEFLGSDIRGRDVIVIDDMISSGGSMLDTSKQLKERGARRVFICCTFGLFTDGLDAFDSAYENGWFDKVVTTNLTYLNPELKERKWFAAADMSKYLATIIDYFNHDASISNVTTPTDKIHEILDKYNREGFQGAKVDLL
jgi:ribose-phosphate pyrophosphokinase